MSTMTDHPEGALRKRLCIDCRRAVVACCLLLAGSLGPLANAQSTTVLAASELVMNQDWLEQNQLEIQLCRIHEGLYTYEEMYLSKVLVDDEGVLTSIQWIPWFRQSEEIALCLRSILSATGPILMPPFPLDTVWLEVTYSPNAPLDVSAGEAPSRRLPTRAQGDNDSGDGLSIDLQDMQWGIDIGRIVSFGGLSHEAVSSIIDYRSPVFDSCYERQRLVQKELGGTIIVDILIGTDGRLRGSRLTPDNPQLTHVAKCIANAVGDFRFPLSKGSDTVVSIPIFLYPDSVFRIPSAQRGSFGGPFQWADIRIELCQEAAIDASIHGSLLLAIFLKNKGASVQIRTTKNTTSSDAYRDCVATALYAIDYHFEQMRGFGRLSFATSIDEHRLEEEALLP